MIVYMLLYGLLHVWKLHAGGLLLFGAANTCLFRIHHITDFDTHNNFWTGEVVDTETAASLLTFHAVFYVLLAIGWILLVGREWVYQTEVLPYLRPEPPRPFLERVRKRWG
jgi:hypothetical protein